MRVSTLRQKGFTLIEMIITVSIMLVILGGSIAAFINFNDKQVVQATASEVKQVLKSARTKARVRDNTDQAGGCVLQGYKVETNGSSIETKLLCGPGKFSITEGQNRDTYQVPTGITVTAMDISFYTLLGSAEVTVPADNIIRINGGSKYYRFEIQGTGEISEGCFVNGPASDTCL